MLFISSNPDKESWNFKNIFRIRKAISYLKNYDFSIYYFKSAFSERIMINLGVEGSL